MELSTWSLSGMSLLHKGYDTGFSSCLLLACLLSLTPLLLSAIASQKVWTWEQQGQGFLPSP